MLEDNHVDESSKPNQIQVGKVDGNKAIGVFSQLVSIYN